MWICGKPCSKPINFLFLLKAYENRCGYNSLFSKKPKPNPKLKIKDDGYLKVPTTNNKL